MPIQFIQNQTISTQQQQQQKPNQIYQVRSATQITLTSFSSTTDQKQMHTQCNQVNKYKSHKI